MKVLITQRLVQNAEYPELRDALDVRWAKLLDIAGITPVLFPSCSDPKGFIEQFDISGAILTGGGEVGSVSNDKLSKSRDLFEKEILELCLSNNLPVLGVCRGLEFICQYYGSSFVEVTGHVSQEHPLDISEELPPQFAPLENMNLVNSYHNIAPREVSLPLKVAATHNGVIEAVYHESKNIFGIMWHPERVDGFCESDIEIIKNLFS